MNLSYPVSVTVLLIVEEGCSSLTLMVALFETSSESLGSNSIDLKDIERFL
jgi:hypothetical protein